MTRTGTSKQVDSAYARGRLRKAIAFHEVSRIALEHIEYIGDPDPVLSNAILAAIAYTDALTAAYGGRINQKDRAAAVKLLRDTLGKALPDVQERRLHKMLARKDEVQYGSRAGRSQDAELFTKNLDEFGIWAKESRRSGGNVKASFTQQVHRGKRARPAVRADQNAEKSQPSDPFQQDIEI